MSSCYGNKVPLSDLFFRFDPRDRTRLSAEDRQERGGNFIASAVPTSKRLVIVSDFLNCFYWNKLDSRNSGLLTSVNIFFLPLGKTFYDYDVQIQIPQVN